MTIGTNNFAITIDSDNVILDLGEWALERIGIDVIGDSMTVTDNEVSDVVVNSGNGTDRAFGIRIVDSNSTNVSGNRVLNRFGLFPITTSNSGILFQNCG